MRKQQQWGILILLTLLFYACELDNDTSYYSNSSNTTSSSSSSSSSSTTTASNVSSDTVDDALAENKSDHEDSSDYTWDTDSATVITLKYTSIEVDGVGASVLESTVTIDSAGTYIISGTLDDGQIIVNTESEETVKLILNGIDVTCNGSSPIYVANAKKTVITLKEGSTNYLADNENYVFGTDEDGETEDEPNATLFSKDDLTIAGSGKLVVTAKYNDGITSKDGLIIKDVTLDVIATDDGIRGKDYLVIKSGTITIDAKGDGLKADNDEDTERGYIYIEGGIFDITAISDGIQAATDVLITDGTFNLTTGGGSQYIVSSSSTAKALKASVAILIDGGDFNISSADDAIHANESLAINGGTFQIASGDDGIHADSYLGINGGDIIITKSYEGIESGNITINGGNINLVASDDGINCAGGNDGSGMNGWQSSSSSNYTMVINGGYIVVNSSGDGLDANGSITMTGGTALVNGPTSSGNGALDYDTSFNISGGILIGAGSSGMAQAPSSSSSQYSVLVNLTSSNIANKIFHIETSDGTEVFTFAPTKKYSSVVFSLPTLEKGSYSIYIGGSHTGNQTNGLYEDGTYTAGSNYNSFSIFSTITTVGTISRMH